MVRGLIVFVAGAALSASAGWLAFPNLLYKRVAQPASFNHQVHTVKGAMGCTDCHAFSDTGAFAGVPNLSKCSGCHAAPMGTTQAEKEFIDQFVTPNREPQWLVYARQPDNAWFPHSPHVTRGKLACTECHGDHGKSVKLRIVEVNRISGYTRDVMGGKGYGAGMRMDRCVHCHESRGLKHSCLDCHK